MNASFQFRSTGLDYIYLDNGVLRQDTPYGPGVSIADAEGLHAAILRQIITSPACLCGREALFICSVLRLRAGLDADGLESDETWRRFPEAPVCSEVDRSLRTQAAASLHLTAADLPRSLVWSRPSPMHFRFVDAVWQIARPRLPQATLPIASHAVPV